MVFWPIILRRDAGQGRVEIALTSIATETGDAEVLNVEVNGDTVRVTYRYVRAGPYLSIPAFLRLEVFQLTSDEVAQLADVEYVRLPGKER